MDNYRTLSLAKNKKSRVDASMKLLKHLEEHPNENDYMLKRLLLGLVSTSDASRQSHFVCLVEFLRQHEIGMIVIYITVIEVLPFLIEINDMISI